MELPLTGYKLLVKINNWLLRLLKKLGQLMGCCLAVNWQPLSTSFYALPIIASSALQLYPPMHAVNENNLAVNTDTTVKT